MAVDALDIVTTDEARTAISVPTGHLAEIEQFVTAVSRAIDDVCGPVVQRTVTEEHDGNRSTIRPRETPVASVTTLKEWDGSGAVTTLTEDAFGSAGAADGFRLKSSGYAHGHKLERRSSGTKAAFARDVELVYVAGRSADTASVDPKFKNAASTVLRDLWSRAAGAWARGEDPFTEGGLSVSLSNAVDKVISGQIPKEKRPWGAK